MLIALPDIPEAERTPLVVHPARRETARAATTPIDSRL
jgi:hypothetical protein